MPPAQAESSSEIEIEEAEPTQVRQWLDDQEIVLVDVRETSEYEQEHIPGALLCPLSMFEAENFPKFPGRRLVVHCAVGKRSAAAAKQLIQSGYGDVTNLRGGLALWKEAGCPTEVQQHGADGPNELPLVIVGNETSADKSVPASSEGAHPGRILKLEFMEPLVLDSAKLAAAIGVPESVVGEIVGEKRGVSAEVALRLARYLCTTDEFWLRLQLLHDLEKARNSHAETIRREVRPRRGNG